MYLSNKNTNIASDSGHLAAQKSAQTTRTLPLYFRVRSQQTSASIGLSSIPDDVPAAFRRGYQHLAVSAAQLQQCLARALARQIERCFHLLVERRQIRRAAQHDKPEAQHQEPG
jgi:hypothetical protein